MIVKLDLDGPLDRDGLGHRLRFLASVLKREPTRLALRRTRHGYHVTFHLEGRRIPPLGIVAIQAILGSDYHRETFNLFRALQLPKAPAFWRDRHNVLYHRKLEEEQAV